MLKRMRNLVAPPVVEQRAALLAGKHITYTLKRSSRRRSIGLHIDDRGLIVSVPLRATESWLQSVLQDKARWVVEKLEGWQACKPVEIRWVDGEELAYLGEQLILRVSMGLFATPALRRGRELWVYVAHGSESQHIEKAVSCWYRNEAERLFAERVEHYSPVLQAAPRQIRLSSAKTQWGCCTAGGTVHLNVQLVKLPLRLIDYVVVHELSHLRELNHSAAFWRIVESACPNYARLRSELRAIDL